MVRAGRVLRGETDTRMFRPRARDTANDPRRGPRGLIRGERTQSAGSVPPPCCRPAGQPAPPRRACTCAARRRPPGDVQAATQPSSTSPDTSTGGGLPGHTSLKGGAREARVRRPSGRRRNARMSRGVDRTSGVEPGRWWLAFPELPSRGKPRFDGAAGHDAQGRNGATKRHAPPNPGRPPGFRGTRRPSRLRRASAALMLLHHPQAARVGLPAGAARPPIFRGCRRGRAAGTRPTARSRSGQGRRLCTFLGRRLCGATPLWGCPPLRRRARSFSMRPSCPESVRGLVLGAGRRRRRPDGSL